MKTHFIIGLLLLFVLGAFQIRIKDGATLSGEIQNHENNQLKIRDFMGKSAWVEYIDIVGGKFAITLPIDKPAIKSISYGNSFKDIYLHPGKTLEITFDAENVEGSWKFGGSLSVENTLLDSLSTKLNDLDYSIAYYQPLDIAKSYLDSIENDRQLYFDELAGNYETLPAFREYVDGLIAYNYAFLKVMIGERHEEQPAGYYDFLDELTIEEEKFLDIPRYRYFLSYYISMEANKRLDREDPDFDPSPGTLLDESLKVVENLKKDQVRDYAIFNLINAHLQEHGLKGFEKYYDYFQKHNTDPHYAVELQKVYEQKQLLAPGNPAPSFTLKDVDGHQVSLEDFKGKYVMIDFWQTLCPRSGKELPHYLEVYSDYKDKNIAFVSISVDQDENKWRDYVKEKKNIGTSLRVLNSWDSKVYQDYQVPGLPTFILIDTEGNIIEPVAPKPSSQEMRETLDKVLNK